MNKGRWLTASQPGLLHLRAGVAGDKTALAVPSLHNDRAQRDTWNRPALWGKDHSQLRTGPVELKMMKSMRSEVSPRQVITEVVNVASGAARADGILGAVTTKSEKIFWDAGAPQEELWWMQKKVKSISCPLKVERLTPTLFWRERRKWKWQRKINGFFFCFKGTLHNYIKISPWAAILSSWSSFLLWANLILPKPKQLLVMLSFLKVTHWKPCCSYFWCVFPLQCKSSLQIKRLSGEDISPLHLSLPWIKSIFSVLLISYKWYFFSRTEIACQAIPVISFISNSCL